MDEPDGKRLATVVLGPPVALFLVIAAVAGGLYLVPGAPCHGGNDIQAPDTEVAIAFNGSTVTAIHVDDEPLGGQSTRELLLVVQDFETDSSRSVQWLAGGGVLRRGDSVTLTERRAGFRLTDRDRAIVRWVGRDPGVAGFCIGSRTFGDLAVTELRNATVPIASS